jgi:hypothetical protein
LAIEIVIDASENLEILWELNALKVPGIWSFLDSCDLG